MRRCFRSSATSSKRRETTRMLDLRESLLKTSMESRPLSSSVCRHLLQRLLCKQTSSNVMVHFGRYCVSNQHLHKVRTQLLQASLKFIKATKLIPANGTLLIVEGIHGQDQHCTARVFREDGRYIGTAHFFLDVRMTTIALDGPNKRSARRHPIMAKWRVRNLKDRLHAGGNA
ncbi:hypothetical protein BJ912DRAFT_580 [Pholiota molesta]|nr:hypothetical protein BJ912DRAFT_285111 [Pholiota molesta]KAF8204549.1 hypothetical protein BJ912DRAFT_580 [Pholiota molesta]